VLIFHLALYWSKQPEKQIKERMFLGAFPRSKLILVYLEGKTLVSVSSMS